MNTAINSLTVLRGLNKNDLFLSLAKYCCCEESCKANALNDLLYEIYRSGAENDLTGYVDELILTDDNAFSRGCAKSNGVSAFLSDAVLNDLQLIREMLESLKNCEQFELGNADLLLTESKSAVINKLKNFYAERGYGQFIRNKAFRFSGGDFIPVTNADEITLERLKNYSDEKTVILNNVGDFLNGLPYSHMLLYGDKGTGKSSTVHAIVNKFFDKKLRLVEISKNDLSDIPDIKQRLAGNPLKFILFLDDLSLDEKNDDISTVKTVLEGSFANAYGNVMLIATSNRRHIVKENHSDRENSVHPSDAMEEQLSLSDRFGLTVMFATTDKQTYLSIVDQLARDCKLITDTEKLHAIAERWALLKGGRSPRRAKQFVDYAYACEQSQRQIEF